MQDAINIKVLQTLSPERKRHCFRSAGACPSRVFDRNEKRRGERSAGACPPRSLPKTKNVRSPRGHGRLLLRPAHGEGQALALRLTGTVSYFRMTIFFVAEKSPACNV